MKGVKGWRGEGVKGGRGGGVKGMHREDISAKPQAGWASGWNGLDRLVEQEETEATEICGVGEPVGLWPIGHHDIGTKTT